MLISLMGTMLPASSTLSLNQRMMTMIVSPATILQMEAGLLNPITDNMLGSSNGVSGLFDKCLSKVLC